MRKPILLMLLCITLLCNVFFIYEPAAPTAMAAEDASSSSVTDDSYAPVAIFDKDFSTSPLGLMGSDLGFDYSSYTSGTGSAVVEQDPFTGTAALHIKASNVVTSDATLRNEFQLSKTFGEPYTGTISTEITFMQTGSKKDDRIIQFYPSQGATFMVGAGVTASKGLAYLLSTAPAGDLGGTYQVGEWHTIRLDFNTVTQRYSLFWDGNLINSQSRTQMNKTLPVYNLKRIVIAPPGTSGDLWVRGIKVTRTPFQPQPPAPKLVFSGSRNSRVMWTAQHYSYASKYRIRIKLKGETQWRNINNANTYWKDYTGTSNNPSSDINAFYDLSKLANTPLVNGQTYTLGLSTVTRDEYGLYTSDGKPGDFESKITEFDGTPYATTPVQTPETSVVGGLTAYANYYGYLWSLQSGTKVGDHVFNVSVANEVPFQFTQIPDKYANMERIATTYKDVMRYPNGFDGTKQDSIIGFKVKDKAAVYVAIDKNATIPSWMSDWGYTGDEIKINTTTSGYTFHIYKKEFAAGTDVLLGYNDYTNFDAGTNAGYFAMVDRVSTGLTLDPVQEWVNSSAYKMTGSVSESVYMSVYQNGNALPLPTDGWVQAGTYELDLNLLPGANLFDVYTNRLNSTFKDHASATVNQDSIVPEIRISAPPATVRDSVYMLEGSLSKAASLTIHLNGISVVDSVYKAADEPFSFPLTLREGNNSIEVSTSDLAGNSSTSSYTINYMFWAGQGALHDWNGNRVDSLTASKDLLAMKSVTNTTADKKQLTLWFVLYDNDHTMVDFSSASAELNPGETKTYSAGLTLPAQVTGYQVKVFIWDSLKDPNGLSPLSEELVVE
ncbi:hypothetical protein [Paenibacillus hexagrammi]|uniref:Uncharacterized protein n=1 Tax=Paenibacillus hexagrammi TaxID=2908839 RepID=A0ABY3SQP6_9BACL|nr:hypothetical protein [Paenibacillus sp. YPD9-1]UJF35574.1 hypothetical protein L0M14_11015 [Paenibacillus sp. YPD9-1]